MLDLEKILQIPLIEWTQESNNYLKWIGSLEFNQFRESVEQVHSIIFGKKVFLLLQFYSNFLSLTFLLNNQSKKAFRPL